MTKAANCLTALGDKFEIWFWRQGKIVRFFVLFTILVLMFIMVLALGGFCVVIVNVLE